MVVVMIQNPTKIVGNISNYKSNDIVGFYSNLSTLGVKLHII